MYVSDWSSRRSRATGNCVAMVSSTRSSTARQRWSISSSPAMTFCARSASPVTSELTASFVALVTETEDVDDLGVQVSQFLAELFAHWRSPRALVAFGRV